ncbi:MAG: Rpn family recombination-promoting nuclease/putative transposase [Lachnospiraceae bacterium]|nr:Rpn family recombination-promoting nuclease/putative transposase [Lachnospiraceae bacterium]
MVQKKFQELDLTDAFLFAAALEDAETCQLVVELILGRPVGPVMVQVERSMLYAKDFRYVRFDVFASDEMKVSYDLEMQNGHRAELPKRARFHQAEMDATFLKPGAKFQDLPESFIVFMCTFDPFHAKKYRYTYREVCEETGEELGDGSCKIFLNTKGTNKQEVPQELIHFLKYIENSTEACAEEMQDDRIRKLNQKVAALKKSRRLEESYMTMQEMLDDRAAEALAEGEVKGRAEGSARMLALVNAMIKDGFTADIARLNDDVEFCAQMLEKYHLN